MTTTIFDTLQYAKKLIEAGVPEKQAEVQAEAIAEIVENKLVSKQYLDLRLAELKADIVKWVAAMLVAQAAVIAALVKLVK